MASYNFPLKFSACGKMEKFQSKGWNNCCQLYTVHFSYFFKVQLTKVAIAGIYDMYE